MLSVKGIFKDGVAQPDKPVEGHNGQSVIITFLDDTQAADQASGTQLPQGTQPGMNGEHTLDIGHPGWAEQPVDQQASQAVFERERDAYEQLADSLRSQYNGLYVAVRDGQVVDSDADELTLIERVYDRFGYGLLYVRKVGSPLPTVHVPSPRLVTP